jgi:hypothetical protein
MLHCTAYIIYYNEFAQAFTLLFYITNIIYNCLTLKNINLFKYLNVKIQLYYAYVKIYFAYFYLLYFYASYSP